MRKRLSIWLQGGIGNGNFSQGYPMLEKLIIRISEDFDVVVFSHAPPNEGYHAKHFWMYYPPRSLKSGKIRWLFLLYLFFREYRKQKFNLLLAFWGYPTGFIVTVIGKILKLPSATCVMGADAAGIHAIDYGVFHRRIPRSICTWTYQNATALLAISEFQKSKLRSFGIRRTIHVIPWGVDTNMFAFSRRDRGEMIKFIHVGHLNPVKDQATLLKSFALIRKKQPAQLKLFGEDRLNGALQKLARDLDIEKDVLFLDVEPYSKMPQNYREADIMLHTSLSEGQCMALTEAAATGVLMAGTRVGLLHDLGDACGVIVDAGDYEGLAQKVLDIIAHPANWADKTNQARLWSQNHSFDWTVRELKAVLQGL